MSGATAAPTRGTVDETAELVRAVDEMVSATGSLEDAHVVADLAGAERRAHVRDAWTRVADLDLVGLHLPEELGGQGQPFAVHAAVVAALGRRLAATPHLPVLGAALPLLAHGASTEQRDRLLPDVLAGRTVVVVAGLDWTTGAATTGTHGSGDALRVTGTTAPVVQAADADLLLLVDGGTALVVDLAADGVRLEELETLDLARPRALVHLDDVPAEALAHVDADLLHRTLLETTTLAAVESAAAARACLTAIVEYVTIRTQFDRPIGSFQAVQHQVADLFGDVASAEAAVAVAVAALSGTTDGGTSLDEAVRVAAASASEALVRAARDGIHLHGGIGFTWEHHAHLFYRRALTDRALLGTPTQHRRALARALVAAP